MRKFSVIARFFTLLLLCVSFFALGRTQTFAAVANANGQGGALCVTGSGGLDLGSCLILNITTGVRVSDFYSKPADLINLIVRNMFVLGGVILFFMIIFAGFQFLTQGEKGIEKAKTIITTALMGFGIMFAAYWILRIIKIITGADIVF